MTVFPGFDRIRIINLPSRPDRRSDMTGELRRLGLDADPRVQFVDGVLVDNMSPWRSRGEKGVFLAHLGVLQDAAAAGESVLILEDDVDFTAAAQSWNPPESCDIAYGGYEATDPSSPEASDIVGAHCMGFSARAVRAAVPFLEKLLAHPSPPPIDGAYVWFRRQTDGFVTEFANPVVAIQRPSMSDIARGSLDTNPVLRLPLQLARRTKRSLIRGSVTFGLREAVILSIAGTAIGSLAAYFHLAR
jgi:glycosyl transferase family 25